jgi:hypothetical protein
MSTSEGQRATGSEESPDNSCALRTLRAGARHSCPRAPGIAMNQRKSIRPANASKSGRGRKILLVGGLSVLVLGVAGLIAGGAVARGIVRGKLQLIAQEAGLQFELADVSVSLLGRVHLSGLAFKRKDGTNIVAVQDADAQFSPWKVLMGKRRPQRTEVKTFLLDVAVQDGKPRELLDLYKAARKVFPKREKKAEEEEKTVSTAAFAMEQGTVQVRVLGKGSQYLPQGLRAHDIAVHLDLANGVGDMAAVLDGTVARKLTASLVAQKEGPPKLQAKFAPEFRLKMPEGAPLPLGVDSLSVSGFSYDATEGPAIEDVLLRKAEQVLVQVHHVRPAPGGTVGVSAEDIAFTLPEKALGGHEAAPPAGKPAKGQKKPGAPTQPPVPQPAQVQAPQGPRMWKGTAERLTLGLDGLEGGEIPLVVKLEKLKVSLPGDLGTLGVQALELRTDRIPGEHALEALTLLHVEQPSVDLPWREDAMQAVPGGKMLWAAIIAAEQAKVRQQVEDSVEEEIDDPNLPPDVKRKKVLAKVEEKMKAAGMTAGDDEKLGPAKKGNKGKPATTEAKKEPGAANHSHVATYVKPLRDLEEKLLGLDGKIHKGLDKMAQAPRLKVEVVGGRFGLVKPGSEKPFGGMQDATLTFTPVLGDGTRSVVASAKPFDDERTWGEVSLDVTTKPGGQLDRARFKLAGGQFAQALRIVSSGVTVKADSDIAVNLEVRTGQAEASLLKITGDFSVKKIGFDWWRLAPRPIEDLSASGKVDVQVSDNDGSMRVNLPGLTVGQARMDVLLEATNLREGGPKSLGPTVRVRAEMPRQDCGAVAKSIPPGMMTTIGPVEAKGEISWLMDLAIPLQNVYKATLDLAMDDATCEVTKFGNVNLEELKADFARPVNENGTLLDDVLVGPSSGAWVPLKELKHWTPWAMIATEDGAFYKHHGIRPGLLLRAIRLDLDYGRFVYGGSTITQQLVKNIFLTRAKNLSRKFEELLIVWQMEHQLEKDRILELYVNFIEFGPKVYGVQRAAQTYFGKDARELTPLESAFLAANKPCPRCGYARFAGKKWDPWWQERMIGIMNKMRDEGIITEEQFLAEAPYIPRFVGWPAPQVAQPSAPLGGVEE